MGLKKKGTHHQGAKLTTGINYLLKKKKTKREFWALLGEIVKKKNWNFTTWGNNTLGHTGFHMNNTSKSKQMDMNLNNTTKTQVSWNRSLFYNNTTSENSDKNGLTNKCQKEDTGITVCKVEGGRCDNEKNKIIKNQKSKKNQNQKNKSTPATVAAWDGARLQMRTALSPPPLYRVVPSADMATDHTGPAGNGWVKGGEAC